MSVLPASSNSKFCLLIGESQAGKSTFVNCIAGRVVAPVGNGNGYSVTANTCVYSAEAAHGLHLIDSPGGLDTNLRTDQEILKEIEYVITKKSSKTGIDVILLAESLTGDTMQVQRNLQRLKTTFGPNVSQSIIVLGTKPGLSNILYGNTRITAVKNECIRLSLNFLTFETYANYQNKTLVSGAQLNTQMVTLKNLMNQINQYELSNIAAIRKKMKQKTQKLMNDAPIRYTTKYYSESYSDPYTASESYNVNESYVENEQFTVQEPYQAAEHYIEMVWDVIDKETNVFKWGRRPKKIWGHRPVSRTRAVTRYRNVTKTRPVAKHRSVTKYRNVTKYRTKTRQKSTQIAIPKDINVFRLQAMNEWDTEMRQSLKRKVAFV